MKQRIRRELPDTPRPLVGLCLKEYEHEDVNEIRSLIPRQSYIARMVTECDSVLDDSGGTMIMIPCTRADLNDIREIRDTMRCANHAIVLEWELTSAEVHLLISSLDILISQRLHPLILATLVPIPIVAIPYAVKVRSYMKELGMLKNSVSYEELGRGKLRQKVAHSLKEREEVCANMRQLLVALQGRAQISVDLLKKLIETK